MVDVLEKTGVTIDTKKLEKELGCKVVTISALKGKGTKEAAQEAIRLAKAHEVGKRPEIFSGHLLKAIQEIEGKLDGDMKRWFAIKLFERDNKVIQDNNLNPDFCSFITKLSKVMNASKDYTADARNSFEKICDKIFESDEEQEAYCKEHNIPF